MKHYTEFDFNFADVKTSASKGVRYLNIECAFDTETSSIINKGEKTGLCYIWMIGFGDSDEHIYYGRYLEEFVKFINELSLKLELNDKKRLKVYVHNLSFDFQFIKGYFRWLNIFATAPRVPIKAITISGVEFTDSLVLSGYSLANVGKHLTKHKINKAVGDLDYTLIRTPQTPLTEQELYYCQQDIRVLLAYINEEKEEYKNVARIPLTNTGKVRRDVRDSCLYYEYNNMARQDKEFRSCHTRLKRRYHDEMYRMILSIGEYKLAKDVYQGGFTHANCLWVNQTLEVGKDGVLSLISKDFTSSYPSVMIAEKFPCSKPIEIALTEEYAKWHLANDFAFMTRVKIWGLRSKFCENYISRSKCQVIKNEVLNNGRVMKADYLETAINELDYDIITKVYDYDHIEFYESYQFRLHYLPTAIVRNIIKYYVDKTTLKDVPGEEATYMNAKGKLNSIYGMTVMDLIKPEIEYLDNEWSVNTEMSDDEILNKVQESGTRFLYYMWGVWVSAYARHNLWSGILAANEDFIYSDTDSIKIRITANNKEHMMEYFNNYNKEVLDKLQQACSFHHLDYSRIMPVTIKGVCKPLGVWDDDGNYLIFKTLGAKRYLTYDGKEIKLTCAGVGKKAGSDYMKELANYNGTNPRDVFDVFNYDLVIPANKTGKNTHLYNDKVELLSVTDYLGNKGDFLTRGGVFIEPASFTLNKNQQWLRLLEEIFIKREIFVAQYREGY